MDANKRLILAIAISLGVLLIFQILFPPAPPPPPPTEAEEMARVEPTPEAEEEAEPEARSEVAAEPERTASLETEALRLVFTNWGAGIAQAELLGPKGRRQGKDAAQVDLADGLLPEDLRLFEIQTGGGLPAFGKGHACQLVGESAEEIRFRCASRGLVLSKTFRLTGERTLSLVANLRNEGPRTVEGFVDLVVPARVDPANQGGGGCMGIGRAGPSPTQMVCRHGDDLTSLLYDPSEPVVRPPGPVSFAGIEERYFLAVAVPVMPRLASSCELSAVSNMLLETHLRTETGRIPPGESIDLRWELVLGQKEIGFLKGVSQRVAAEGQIANPELDETVDLGFWAAIARILLWFLNLFHSMIPNWGVAIILLTVLVKLLTLPLSWKSMKSMEEVRKLAPEIEKLKAKYGEDREKLNMEMMALYQRHKVNPLGGCLPMLIQMPIWIALYTTLLSSVELYNEPFIAGWISDLTSKDPFYILPVSMGVTMFLTQKLQPMQVDATQQKMLLYFMPIFFTLIMLNLPAGLTLYIFTNNVLSIGQQLALRKAMGIETPRPEAKGESRKGKKS